MCGCRWVCVALLTVSFAWAQGVTLTARVELMRGDKGEKPHESGNVLVWLVPASGFNKAAFPQTQKPRLVQRNKSFEPHVLMVPVGSVVAFPNHDPFFHNVFSLFEGKRFDLGLYEAGITRDVHFDRPGISYIFCNIHPEMSAVVVALDTPYYGISDSQGQVVIANVPSGKYTLRLWYESALPETLKAAVREVTVSEASSTLGVLRLAEANLPATHKNLYGRDYDSPTPDTPAYQRH
jgi:plastocyanin